LQASKSKPPMSPKGHRDRVEPANEGDHVRCGPKATALRSAGKCRDRPEGDIADSVPYNGGRRLRRPHFLRRRRVGHPFYVIAREDDRNRMSVVGKEVEA
jgi:hypothetical protein